MSISKHNLKNLDQYQYMIRRAVDKDDAKVVEHLAGYERDSRFWWSKSWCRATLGISNVQATNGIVYIAELMPPVPHKSASVGSKPNTEALKPTPVGYAVLINKYYGESSDCFFNFKYPNGKFADDDGHWKSGHVIDNHEESIIEMLSFMIISMAIEPEYRGMGVGTSLMKHAACDLLARHNPNSYGIYPTLSAVIPDDNFEALKTARRAGFRNFENVVPTYKTVRITDGIEDTVDYPISCQYAFSNDLKELSY